MNKNEGIKVTTFRINTDEYEPFEGKTLKMLISLLNESESVEMYHNHFNGLIEIVGSKYLKPESYGKEK